MQRLASLDARAARRWPWFEAKGPAYTLRLLVVYQTLALAEIFVGIATGNDVVTGLASGPLVLGAGSAWRLLRSTDDDAGYPPT